MDVCRFYLSLISPVLFDIFNDTLYNALADVVIILPDYSRHEVKKLKKLFLSRGDADESWSCRSSLVEALSVLQAADKSKANSPIGKKSVSKPMPDYYEPIPDISNLDSLELFDPVYLEDIEIQNEENLSLTIHR